MTFDRSALIPILERSRDEALAEVARLRLQQGTYTAWLRSAEMERDKARSDLMAAWDRIRMLEVTLGRVKDPASPPPAAEPETCGHPVSTPMRAGTSMPCPHSPPCPLPGTRYSEGYCVARSEYALAPAPRPRVDAEE